MVDFFSNSILLFDVSQTLELLHWMLLIMGYISFGAFRNYRRVLSPESEITNITLCLLSRDYTGYADGAEQKCSIALQYTEIHSTQLFIAYRRPEGYQDIFQDLNRFSFIKAKQRHFNFGASHSVPKDIGSNTV